MDAEFFGGVAVLGVVQDFVYATYDWIKWLHVVSAIAWMAGLLYLPRLFVYHCAAPVGSHTSETFKVMERRLLRAIMNPAMVATWCFGLLLASAQDLASGWLLAKFAGVLGLTWHHHLQSRWRKDFAEDRNARPARFYRLHNEVPTVLMVLIVLFVIVKPF
jgi:protoporphyrinogen IX oxidase